MTLGKTLALSGPLEKIALKVPSYRMHGLPQGLSVTKEAGCEGGVPGVPDAALPTSFSVSPPLQ